MICCRYSINSQKSNINKFIVLKNLIFLAFIVFAPCVMAQDKAPMELEADSLSYLQKIDTIKAKGNVDVKYQGYHMTANEMSYDRKLGQITATGNVVLTSPNGDVHKADAFNLSGDMQKGTIAALNSLMADDSNFTAQDAVREDGNITVMHHASYTPCPTSCADGSPKEPTWKITARKVIHNEEDATITYKDAYFKFMGVPFFYTPYFEHPDGTLDQKSGFLPPHFGYASDLGFKATGLYYIAIDKDEDATVGVTAMSKEKPLLLGQWRKAWSDASLLVDGSITRGERKDLSDNGKDDWRGHLFADGAWDINSKWRAGTELRLVTDDRFLRRYDIDQDIDVLTNQVYAERFEGRNYTSARMMGFRDLRTNTQEVDQPFILPEIKSSFMGDAGSVSIPAVGLNARWGFDASFLGLQRDGNGQDVTRASAKGTIVGRDITNIGAVIDWQALIRQDLYYVDNYRKAGFPNQGDSSQVTRGRFFPQLHVKGEYPLAKNVNLMDKNLRAVITPITSLTFGGNVDEGLPIPNEDSQDVQLDASNLFEANRFPGLDRIEDGSRVTYGVRAGLYSNNGAKLTALVGQSYRFDQNTNPFPRGSGLEDQASDVVGQFTFRIPREATIIPGTWEIDYNYQLDSSNLESRRHEFDISTNVKNMNVGVRYLFSKALEGTPLLDSREQVEARIARKIKGNFDVNARILYDLGEDEGMREAGFGVMYTGDCTSWGISVERRLTNDDAGQNGTSVMFRVGLKNLGDFNSG